MGVASVAGYRGYTRAEAYGPSKAAEAGKAEAVFPPLYRIGMKLVRLVPIRLYTAVSRRLT